MLDVPEVVNHLSPKKTETRRKRTDMTTALDMAPGLELKYIDPEITMTDMIT